MEQIIEITKNKKTKSLEVGQIVEVKRTEKRYRLNTEELKEGGWLKEIPEGENIEISFKNGYLSIKDFNSNSRNERRS